MDDLGGAAIIRWENRGQAKEQSDFGVSGPQRQELSTKAETGHAGAKAGLGESVLVSQGPPPGGVHSQADAPLTAGSLHRVPWGGLIPQRTAQLRPAPHLQDDTHCPCR